MIGPRLRRKLKFYHLTTAMTQAIVEFSQVLTKKGNVDALDENLLNQDFTKKRMLLHYEPEKIRLFFKNEDVAPCNSLT